MDPKKCYIKGGKYIKASSLQHTVCVGALQALEICRVAKVIQKSVGDVINMEVHEVVNTERTQMSQSSLG